MQLQFFICHEGRAEDQEERPAHPEATAAKIEYKERAEQSTESKLKRIDEPEMNLGWVLGISTVIFRAVDEKDANGNGGEVRDDPEVFPKRINPFKRYGIEGESTKERGRRNGPLEARVGGPQVGAKRSAEDFGRHGPGENSMGPEQACRMGGVRPCDGRGQGNCTVGPRRQSIRTQSVSVGLDLTMVEPFRSSL
jgi:hypothetical protein